MKKLRLFILLFTGIKYTNEQCAYLKSDYFTMKKGLPERTPCSVKEKIMQPIFATKPTGEGTELGLSLTYDMVVKEHGGSIQVNSVEGEGSDFIISIPIN